MTASYTFDIFSTLDGYGSYGPDGDWGGYWGKQGPELLDRRMSLYDNEQRMVVGARTFRQYLEMLGSSVDTSGVDAWNLRTREYAGNGGVIDPSRPARLAERDRRERRRRRYRRSAQGGVRGAVALARQPVVEPGVDGRSTSSTLST